MADNRESEKMVEEQIMNMNISNISCSSEVISPQTTINDDSNNGDTKNSTCSTSVAVKTKIICSDIQKSECNIIIPKNTNFRSNEKSPGHNDTIVKSDDNESNLEDINDNDGDSNDGTSSRNDRTDAFISDSQDVTLLMESMDSLLNVEQAKLLFFMNSNPVARYYINETSFLEQNVVKYEYNDIDEIVDFRYTTEKQFYLVKWKNWSIGFNTWEPFEALLNVQKHIFKFMKKNPDFNKSVNIMHLMLSRQIISQLFEKFRTSTGLSLPSISLEDVSFLLNLPAFGRESAQKMRKMTIRSNMEIMSLEYFRQQQNHELSMWEMEINIISQNSDIIVVENDVDLDNPPNLFVYVTDYYIPEGKIIIPDNPLSGCLCNENCSFSDNCCKTLSGSGVYDEHKKLIVTPECPIFECNKKCKCSSSCVNRVVQHGSDVKVCIYKTMSLGWALKTCQNIQKGQFVGIYVGEIITDEEYNQRLQDSSSSIDNTWKLDFNDTKNFNYIVDSTHYGNFTRFINHSCEANLNIHSVWINCLDKYFPHLALFANRDILANEPLTTDYLISGSKNSLKKSGIKCECKMKKCKGYFF